MHPVRLSVDAARGNNDVVRGTLPSSADNVPALFNAGSQEEKP
jgi:hypothetical protein